MICSQKVKIVSCLYNIVLKTLCAWNSNENSPIAIYCCPLLYFTRPTTSVPQSILLHTCRLYFYAFDNKIYLNHCTREWTISIQDICDTVDLMQLNGSLELVLMCILAFYLNIYNTLYTIFHRIMGKN